MGYRLEFESLCGIYPEEVYLDHAKTNIAAGVPTLRGSDAHDRPLAIVGGGPSAGRYLEELRDFEGDIWGINQGAAWLSGYVLKGKVWMFTVDPDECMAGPQFVIGVERAILGSSCHPKLFEALKGKDVQMFHTHQTEGVSDLNLGGPSSVTRVFIPSMWMGYKDLTFYGCEGSFESVEVTHAYRNENKPKQLLVKAGEKHYLTTVDLYLTTRYLAGVMKEFPGVLKEKSGGLLRAMLEFPDTWEVVALSKALRDQIDPTATEVYEAA